MRGSHGMGGKMGTRSVGCQLMVRSNLAAEGPSSCIAIPSPLAFGSSLCVLLARWVSPAPERHLPSESRLGGWWARCRWQETGGQVVNLGCAWRCTVVTHEGRAERPTRPRRVAL